MSGVDPDEDAATRARAALSQGDVTGWFEPLYAAAAQGEAVVPWDRGEAHPLLVDWATQGSTPHTGRAMVVGCGLGHDAEYAASLGYDTTAFDVSPTAIEGARALHPHSTVDYHVANLFDLPADWRGHFDLVVETMTVQAMPRSVRSGAIAAIRPFVAPGGTLLVIGWALPPGQDLEEGPPWPLSSQELDEFAAEGLVAGPLVSAASDDGGTRYRLELNRPRTG